jgi:hypothetical protein
VVSFILSGAAEAAAYPPFRYGRSPMQEGLAFHSKGSNGVVGNGAASARGGSRPFKKKLD